MSFHQKTTNFVEVNRKVNNLSHVFLFLKLYYLIDICWNMCHSDNISLNTLTVNSFKILKFSKAFKARIIPNALLNYEITVENKQRQWVKQIKLVGKLTEATLEITTGKQ